MTAMMTMIGTHHGATPSPPSSSSVVAPTTTHTTRDSRHTLLSSAGGGPPLPLSARGTATGAQHTSWGGLGKSPNALAAMQHMQQPPNNVETSSSQAAGHATQQDSSSATCDELHWKLVQYAIAAASSHGDKYDDNKHMKEDATTSRIKEISKSRSMSGTLDTRTHTRTRPLTLFEQLMQSDSDRDLFNEPGKRAPLPPHLSPPLPRGSGAATGSGNSTSDNGRGTRTESGKGADVASQFLLFDDADTEEKLFQNDANDLRVSEQLRSRQNSALTFEHENNVEEEPANKRENDRQTHTSILSMLSSAPNSSLASQRAELPSTLLKAEDEVAPSPTSPVLFTMDSHVVKSVGSMPKAFRASKPAFGEFLASSVSLSSPSTAPSAAATTLTPPTINPESSPEPPSPGFAAAMPNLGSSSGANTNIPSSLLATPLTRSLLENSSASATPMPSSLGGEPCAAAVGDECSSPRMMPMLGVFEDAHSPAMVAHTKPSTLSLDPPPLFAGISALSSMSSSSANESAEGASNDHRMVDDDEGDLFAATAPTRDDSLLEQSSHRRRRRDDMLLPLEESECDDAHDNGDFDDGDFGRPISRSSVFRSPSRMSISADNAEEEDEEKILKRRIDGYVSILKKYYAKKDSKEKSPRSSPRKDSSPRNSPTTYPSLASYFKGIDEPNDAHLSISFNIEESPQNSFLTEEDMSIDSQSSSSFLSPIPSAQTTNCISKVGDSLSKDEDLVRDWARRLDAEIGDLRRLLSLTSSNGSVSDTENDEPSFGQDLKDVCRTLKKQIRLRRRLGCTKSVLKRIRNEANKLKNDENAKKRQRLRHRNDAAAAEATDDAAEVSDTDAFYSDASASSRSTVLPTSSTTMVALSSISGHTSRFGVSIFNGRKPSKRPRLSRRARKSQKANEDTSLPSAIARLLVSTYNTCTRVGLKYDERPVGLDVVGLKKQRRKLDVHDATQLSRSFGNKKRHRGLGYSNPPGISSPRSAAIRQRIPVVGRPVRPLSVVGRPTRTQRFTPRVPVVAPLGRPRGRVRGPYQTKALTAMGKRPDYAEFRKQRAFELGVTDSVSVATSSTACSQKNGDPPLVGRDVQPKPLAFVGGTVKPQNTAPPSVFAPLPPLAQPASTAQSRSNSSLYKRASQIVSSMQQGQTTTHANTVVNVLRSNENEAQAVAQNARRGATHVAPPVPAAAPTAPPVVGHTSVLQRAPFNPPLPSVAAVPPPPPPPPPVQRAHVIGRVSAVVKPKAPVVGHTSLPAGVAHGLHRVVGRTTAQPGGNVRTTYVGSTSFRR